MEYDETFTHSILHNGIVHLLSYFVFFPIWMTYMYRVFWYGLHGWEQVVSTSVSILVINLLWWRSLIKVFTVLKNVHCFRLIFQPFFYLFVLFAHLKFGTFCCFSSNFHCITTSVHSQHFFLSNKIHHECNWIMINPASTRFTKTCL